VSNRFPRRQGVIYGPPRPANDGAGGALVGRLVGLAMVGLALAVLLGAVMLVNQPPAATPTRQIGPTASPGPASPSAPASVQPSASAGSPSPVPTASPFVPTVHVGPGFVTFGTHLNSDMTVADPRASFKPSDRIAWSAFLTEAADAADVTAQLFKLDQAAPNGERLLSEGGAQPKINDSDHFTRSGIRPGRDLDGPGIYLVRYSKGDAVLAEGYFELRA
jgi:hypothetical protein